MFEDDVSDEKKMLYNEIQNHDIKIIYSQCYEWFNLKTSKSKYLIANVNTSVMHLVNRIIFSLVRFNRFKRDGPSVGQQMHSGHDDTCFHFHWDWDAVIYWYQTQV